MSNIIKKLPQLGYIDVVQGSALFISENGDDANTGTRNSPKKTIPEDIDEWSTIAFERGSTFNWSFDVEYGKTYCAYGDSTTPKPVFIAQDNTTSFSRSIKVKYAEILDLDLRGGTRILYFYSGSNITIHRCHFEGNTGDNCVYFKYTDNIDIQQCTSLNTHGDVIYGTGVNGGYVGYCDFQSVNGGAADSVQFTAEAKTGGYLCSDIVIEYNIFRSDDGSTSGKGAIVVQGTDNYLVQYNDVEGQFFGIGLGGTNGIVQYNTVHSTNKNISWGFGIGVGDQPADGITITNNVINNAKRGLAISDSNTTNPAQRDNIIMENNVVESCDIGIKIDVPHTGYHKNNDYINCVHASDVKTEGG